MPGPTHESTQMLGVPLPALTSEPVEVVLSASEVLFESHEPMTEWEGIARARYSVPARGDTEHMFYSASHPS